MGDTNESDAVEFAKGCLLLSVLALSSYGAWEYTKVFEVWLVDEWSHIEPLMVATSLTLLSVFRGGLGFLHARASNYLLGFRFVLGCPVLHYFVWLIEAAIDWKVILPVCLFVVLYEETIVSTVFPPFFIYMLWLYCGRMVKQVLLEPFEVASLALTGEDVTPRLLSVPMVAFIIVAIVAIRFRGVEVVCKFAHRCWEDRKDLKKIILERHELLERARKNPFYAKLHKDPKLFLQSLSTRNSEWLGTHTKEGTNTLLEGHQSMIDERLRVCNLASAKRDTFYANLAKVHGSVDSFERILLPCRVCIREGESIFQQVSKQLKDYSARRLKNGLNVAFEGEFGVDGGGLTASLFTRIAEEFSQTVQQNSESILRCFDDNTYMLRASELEDIEYYNLGRIVGLAILHGHTLPLPLSSALLKTIVDEEIDWYDVQAVDPVYFRNRMLILLQPGGVEMVKSVLGLEELRFVWLDDDADLGAELCSGGTHMTVNEESKYEYLQLISEHYLCSQVRKEISLFLTGVHELVPAHLFRTCKVDFVELALMLSKYDQLNLSSVRDSLKDA